MYVGKESENTAIVRLSLYESKLDREQRKWSRGYQSILILLSDPEYDARDVFLQKFI